MLVQVWTGVVQLGLMLRSTNAKLFMCVTCISSLWSCWEERERREQMELWPWALHDRGVTSKLWQVAEWLLTMSFKTYYSRGCSDLCVSGRLAETCECRKAERYTEIGSDLKPLWARKMAGRQVVISERETVKESCKLGRKLGSGAVLRCQLRWFSLLCLLQNSSKAFHEPV